MGHWLIGIVSLAILVALFSGLGFIVRDYLRVTHRLGRYEQHVAEQRKRFWPYLTPHELKTLPQRRREWLRLRRAV